MKKNIKISLLILIAVFSLNGCYTVLWMPEDEFPTESSYNEFYSEPYYGDYYSFYDYPWWLGLTPPSAPVGSDRIRTENGTTSSLRNEGQGRGTDNDRKILPTSPPSRDGSSNSSSNNNSNRNSSSSNDSSTSGSSNNNSSNTRSSDNNSIRNNDGNRNTNSGRK